MAREPRITPWIAGVIVSSVTAALLMTVFVYTTFATVSYVDDKHKTVSDTLLEIRSDMKDVREKVYELNGEKAPHKEK